MIKRSNLKFRQRPHTISNRVCVDGTVTLSGTEVLPENPSQDDVALAEKRLGDQLMDHLYGQLLDRVRQTERIVMDEIQPQHNYEKIRDAFKELRKLME